MALDRLRSTYITANGQHKESKIQRRTVPKKIVDGIMFNSELDMLEVRLAELYHVVDWFIVVEGTHTLQGKPKTLHYENNQARFAKWSSKIRHVKLDNNPASVKSGYHGSQEWGDYWIYEEHQRDAIGLRGVQELVDRGAVGREDLVFVMDTDEMPRPDVLNYLRWHDGLPLLIRLWMRWSFYTYSWLNEKGWPVCAAVTVGILQQHHWRTSRLRLDFFSEEDDHQRRVLDVGNEGGAAPGGGWHCSWCFSTRLYLDKLQSFAHREMLKDHPDLKQQSTVVAMKRSGKWLTGKGRGVKALETDPEFSPVYVVENRERFLHLIDPYAPDPPPSLL